MLVSLFGLRRVIFVFVLQLGLASESAHDVENMFQPAPPSTPEPAAAALPLPSASALPHPQEQDTLEFLSESGSESSDAVNLFDSKYDSLKPHGAQEK